MVLPDRAVFSAKRAGIITKNDIRLISAMVAFSMFEAAYYSEIIRAGIQSISRGQSSAALALGMTPLAVDETDYSAAGVPRDGAASAHSGHRTVPGYPHWCMCYLWPISSGTASTIGERDGTQVEMILFAGFVYFVISLSASLLVSYLKRRTA